MGSETIPKRVSGNRDDADWFNIYRRVLAGDLVPRNYLAELEDQAGSLGTSSFRFTNGYILGLLLYNGSHKITFIAPSGLASDYTLQLPNAIPASGYGLLYVTSGGVMSIITPDDSTLEIASSVLRAKAAGTTRAKMPTLGQTVTSSCGVFGFTTEAAITNFSVTLTTTGRPVWLGVVADGTSNSCYIANTTNTAFKWKRDGTTLTRPVVLANPTFPVTMFDHMDVVAAGTYTYTASLASSGGGTGSLNYASMIAFEM